jgi:hypothetical protein
MILMATFSFVFLFTPSLTTEKAPLQMRTRIWSVSYSRTSSNGAWGGQAAHLLTCRVPSSLHTSAPARIRPLCERYVALIGKIGLRRGGEHNHRASPHKTEGKLVAASSPRTVIGQAQSPPPYTVGPFPDLSGRCSALPSTATKFTLQSNPILRGSICFSQDEPYLRCFPWCLHSGDQADCLYVLSPRLNINSNVD